MGQFERYLAMGQEREVQLMRHLAAKGHHVVPVYAVSEDGQSKGPRVHTSRGPIVAPDILCVTPNGHAMWIEAKAKSVPGYRYSREHQGWWHGIDLWAWEQYGKLAERADLWIVVCEAETLPHDDFKPPQPPNKKWDDYKRHLVPGPVWRCIRYPKAKAAGRRQDKWSRGPGWLWPLHAMSRMVVPTTHETTHHHAYGEAQRTPEAINAAMRRLWGSQ